jgi:hypothetical protein
MGDEFCLTFWLRDIPTSLTFNNCTLCHTVFKCFVNSDLCRLQHKLIGFTTEKKSVYSAVRTGSLNEAACASSGFLLVSAFS